MSKTKKEKRPNATSFRICPELAEEFKCYARKRGYTYQDAIEECMKYWINRTDILEK